MRTRLVRQPGQPGTKDLVTQYGDRLICVRYRYDSLQKKRHKTVELIIETVDWIPPLAPDTCVAVRVALHEYDIQRKIRGAGGTWNRTRQVWEMRYDQVLALGLRDRMVDAE